jgi:hypothetical protein
MIGDMPPEGEAELRDEAEQELGAPIPTRVQA